MKRTFTSLLWGLLLGVLFLPTQAKTFDNPKIFDNPKPFDSPKPIKSWEISPIQPIRPLPYRSGGLAGRLTLPRTHTV